MKTLTSNAGRIIFGLIFLAFGFFHFTGADMMAAWMPGWMPAPKILVYISGLGLIAKTCYLVAGPSFTADHPDHAYTCSSRWRPDGHEHDAERCRTARCSIVHVQPLQEVDFFKVIREISGGIQILPAYPIYPSPGFTCKY